MSLNPSPASRVASRRRVRWLHLVLAAPVGAVIYAPLEVTLQLRPLVQWLLLPALGLSGLWLCQGQRLLVALRRRGSTASVSSVQEH